MGFLKGSSLEVSFADKAVGLLFSVFVTDDIYVATFQDAIFYSLAEGAALHHSAAKSCELSLQSREGQSANSASEIQQITSILSISFGMESDIFLSPGEPGIDSLFEYTRSMIRETNCLATVNAGVSFIHKVFFGKIESIAEPGGSFAVSRMTITMEGRTPIVI